MFIINKLSTLSTRSKEVLYKILFNLLAIIFFFLLILSILKTDKLSYIHISPTIEDSLELESTAVSNFNNNSYLDKSDIDNYITDVFTTRNESFLTGSVEDLYKYYNKNVKNSLISLNYEFKRIAYIRDWAIQRNIIFTSITSSINMIDIKNSSDLITLKVDETCTFNYIYWNNKLQNTFKVDLIHIITLKNTGETYSIDKDYYLDFLGDEINKYKFNFTETTLPYNKSVEADFTIPSNYKIADVLSYYKFNFIDHKSVVCGFDTNGYPLINSTTINCINVPYDLGWKDKNIRLE